MDVERKPSVDEWTEPVILLVHRHVVRRWLEPTRQVNCHWLRGANWRLAAVGGMVLLADLTLFRGHGYAGCALFFLLAPVLLLAGMKSRSHSTSVWISGAMLILLAAKLLWCGSVLLVFFGFALTVAIAMSALGHPPFTRAVHSGSVTKNRDRPALR